MIFIDTIQNNTYESSTRIANAHIKVDGWMCTKLQTGTDHITQIMLPYVQISSELYILYYLDTQSDIASIDMPTEYFNDTMFKVEGLIEAPIPRITDYV